MKKNKIINAAVWIVSICIIAFLVPIITIFSIKFGLSTMNDINLDEWIGFAGNVVGGFLSSIITIIVLYITLTHNRKTDEDNRMPYLSMEKEIKKYDGGDQTIINLVNIGSHSAVNITCNTSLSCWGEPNSKGKYLVPAIGVGYARSFIFGHLNIKDKILFEFEDITGIKYKQEIELNKYGDITYNSGPKK